VARGRLLQPRPAECVIDGRKFMQKTYQENTCSDECWAENRRRRWEYLRLTEGCARCKLVKPLTEYTGPTTPYCKDCFNKDRRDRFTAADYRLQNLKKYKMTPETFDALLETQDGRCAICKTDDPGGRHGEWHVDHDHDCCPGSRTCGACVRGLLCQNCNVFIGNAKDDPVRLRAAADYIERPRQPALFLVA